MRPILIACVSLFLLGLPAVARAAPPDPSGLWSTGRGQAVVQVYSCGTGMVCGALVGFALSATDPVPHTWSGRSQCRFVFITGLRPRTRAWFGHIINPQNGHQYGAKIRLMSENQLRLRGYFLMPIFGATRFWTRYEGPPPPGDCRLGQHALD